MFVLDLVHTGHDPESSHQPVKVSLVNGQFVVHAPMFWDEPWRVQLGETAVVTHTTNVVGGEQPAFPLVHTAGRRAAAEVAVQFKAPQPAPPLGRRWQGKSSITRPNGYQYLPSRPDALGVDVLSEAEPLPGLRLQVHDATEAVEGLARSGMAVADRALGQHPAAPPRLSLATLNVVVLLCLVVLYSGIVEVMYRLTGRAGWQVMPVALLLSLLVGSVVSTSMSRPIARQRAAFRRRWSEASQYS